MQHFLFKENYFRYTSFHVSVLTSFLALKNSHPTFILMSKYYFPRLYFAKTDIREKQKTRWRKYGGWVSVWTHSLASKSNALVGVCAAAFASGHFWKLFLRGSEYFWNEALSVSIRDGCGLPDKKNRTSALPIDKKIRTVFPWMLHSILDFTDRKQQDTVFTCLM